MHGGPEVTNSLSKGRTCEMGAEKRSDAQDTMLARLLLLESFTIAVCDLQAEQEEA